MNISKNILFRYENNIEGGKLFIFDTKNYKVYKSGIVEYRVLKGIQQGMSLEDIIVMLKNEYRLKNIDATVGKVIQIMKANGFIEE